MNYFVGTVLASIIALFLAHHSPFAGDYAFNQSLVQFNRALQQDAVQAASQYVPEVKREVIAAELEKRIAGYDSIAIQTLSVELLPPHYDQWAVSVEQILRHQQSGQERRVYWKQRWQSSDTGWQLVSLEPMFPPAI